jgi:Cohesin domain
MFSRLRPTPLPATALAILALVMLTHFGASGAAAADPSLAIDAGIQGNTATSVGIIENCIAVKTNDSFQMDVVVENISDLLAWEIHLDYDPAVIEVTDQNVKLFQQANLGSSVLDVSAHVPDDSGLHELSAFDSSDPPTPDSGTGVLARVTFKALASGASPVGFANRDLNQDGVVDVGTLMRDTNANPIHPDKDGFFDGDRQDAQVVVDGSCPPGSIVAQGTASDTSFPWLLVSGGAGVFVVVLGAAGLTLFSRRQRPRRAPAEE